MCEVCGAMVLVARPGGEERWRTGGKAFEQGCLEEERIGDLSLGLSKGAKPFLR
jgi:hypothetical protein